jgi:hypothetical protein
VRQTALTVRTGRDDTNISWVLDRCDDTSGKDELFPGLSEVDDVDSISSTLPAVGGHRFVQILGDVKDD